MTYIIWTQGTPTSVTIIAYSGHDVATPGTLSKLSKCQHLRTAAEVPFPFAEDQPYVFVLYLSVLVNKEL